MVVCVNRNSLQLGRRRGGMGPGTRRSLAGNREDDKEETDRDRRRERAMATTTRLDAAARVCWAAAGLWGGRHMAESAVRPAFAD